MKIGIQLYSVLSDFKKDNISTLETIADMGYQGIEFAFTFGNLPPEELADLLTKTKMETVGFYSLTLEEVLNPSNEIYIYSKKLINPYIIVGSSSLLKDWSLTIEKTKEAGVIVQNAGMKLLYHNHTEEIMPLKEGGKPALSILAEKTDPEKVMLELDTHFLSKAGENPIEWLDKYKGRVPLLHLKDIKADGSVAEVGEGVLDISAICKKAKEVGVKWLVVEFHEITERTPFESALLSIRNLRKLNV